MGATVARARAGYGGAMDLGEALASRMRRPQRHRLLQGYPAVAAMTRAIPGEAREVPVRSRATTRLRGLDGALAYTRGAAPLEPAALEVDRSRALIVGVIPHTQCVPRREGCGFCTFPHDRADAGGRRRMMDSVGEDMEFVLADPRLAGRRVEAVYLGGGTANLAEPDALRALVDRLAARLDLSGAELTLEGTPRLFDRWFGAHLRALAGHPVGSRRVSVGVQTFDDAMLEKMGRESFGGERTVRAVVRRARALGVSTSADLLCNLPGQPDARMDRDVDTAIDCGFDQICLYNLVLAEGTSWAADPSLSALMPSNDRACARWLALRERLLSAGFVQSTLTNFERAEVARGPARFRYETASFSVERTDAVGFGPMSLSTFVDPTSLRAIKLLRRKSIAGLPWSGEDLMYLYDRGELSRLWITRGLAKTRVEDATYRALFGRPLAEDFSAIPTLVSAGLLLADSTGLALTPTGMFYADAVVSLLALGPRREGEGLRTKDLLAERPSPGIHYLSMG
jgi:coproporphyrinogen III oxidase-like Fe-S oxidoreductase